MIHWRNITPRAFMLVYLSVAALLTGACGILNYVETVDCDGSFWWFTITPPPSAEILEEGCRSGIQADYRVVFTMAPEDLGAFQAASRVVEWTSDPSGLVTYKDEAAQATRLLAGRFGDGVLSIEALIDMSDPNRYLVYYIATYVD